MKCLRLVASLLSDLADGGLSGSLTDLDGTSWQSPPAVVCASLQQNSPLCVEADGSDCRVTKISALR